MTCVAMGLWFVMIVLGIAGIWLRLIRAGHHHEWFWERWLGEWWDRKFPPREERGQAGFDVIPITEERSADEQSRRPIDKETP